jgi:hypothetical protein
MRLSCKRVLFGVTKPSKVPETHICPEANLVWYTIGALDGVFGSIIMLEN